MVIIIITGLCRIPTFGSRIPQISSKPSTSLTPPATEICAKHVGKKVRVGQKDGILKYIGSVHFAKGVWCGVELTNAVGKNDGTVNGVRYFACSNLRGLMAPLSKVSLTEGSCESLHEDKASGPYSILFFDPKLPDSEYCKNIVKRDGNNICVYNIETENINFQKRTFGSDRSLHQNCAASLGDKTNSTDNINQIGLIEKSLGRNRTYDLDNNTKSTEDLRRLVFKEKSLNENLTHTFDKNTGSLQNLANFSNCVNTTYELVHNRTRSIEGLNQILNKENRSFRIFKKPANTTYELKQSESFDSLQEDLNQTVINTTNILQPNQITYSQNPSDELSGADSYSYRHCLNRRNTYEIDKLDEGVLFNLTQPKKRTNDTFKQSELDTGNRTLTITKTDNNFCNEHKNNLTGILPYLPINKSCEDLLNESTLEVKRRRTSNPKVRHLPLDKPSSLPQLRSAHNFDSESSLLNLKQFNHSTPVRTDFTDDLTKRLRISGINVPLDKEDDGSNKRDSLDCDESLGILTPDQMLDFVQTRSPSLEYNPLLSSKLLTKTDDNQLLSPNQEGKSGAFQMIHGLTVDTTKIKEAKEDVQSPNLNSITEYSLGIIDADQMLSAFTILKTDTTMNLELPLDPVSNITKDFILTRCEQTPSPEELPLDTTPIVESEPKTEPTKSKTTSSFITSITSITSLDTGYQGDGEMSRPASRGADNSPLTRRPLPRPQARRPDPMTDSDFYTESDADNHEDNQIKGDRKAQVIDGTLYGVDPQAAADIYVNNRENMDSSGVFTDIESSGIRNEEEVEHANNGTVDVSPSDSSSKTLSENSQNNVHEILHKTTESVDSKKTEKASKENPKKRTAPSPGILSPSSVSSPRHRSKEENAAKKYKMPKRDVASKVKAMLEPTPVTPGEKKSIKKTANRWDAVMNKISMNEQNKTNLKDIKSKVFGSANINSSPTVQRSTEVRKSNTRPVGNQNNKNFSRRVRTRNAHNTTPLKKIVGSTVESSIHSSLSDLSASNTPPKKSSGSAKKREPIQVTQVLTPNKLSARNQQNLVENKKHVNNINASSSNDTKPKRNIFPSKEKKPQSLANKECSKPTVKGGRTSPSVRPPAPQTPRAPVKRTAPPPRTAEALAVLVQHLVFNVEAYQVPHLRRQVEKFRLETEEIRLACQQLEETLADERVKKTTAIEEERIRCRRDIAELIEDHRHEITHLSSQHATAEERLLLEKENSHKYISQKHEEQLTTLRKELDKLQKSHEESLDILREENESIREQIDEKRMELEKTNDESTKLKQDYESKEVKLKEEVDVMKMQRDRLKQQIGKMENDFEEKVRALVEENKRLREENDRLLSYGDDKGIGVQEVQSLRAVLELKQTEVAELRKSLGQANHKLEILVGAEEKASALQARCEDLQHQLQRKSEYEQSLVQEHQKLQESFKEEINQKRRLSQYNEELQWKLKQNKEVITKVMEQAEESALNRSNYSSSFNEKHSATKSNLERTLSFRERSYSNKSSISLDSSSRARKSKNSLEFEMDDLSPPSSPKVKGVVEKSDSVSYVLDLDESPEIVASRIVRRSFRNTTPPKNTPTKSPSNKRPRMRNPLSMSASSSAIITSNKEECERPRSASGRNANCDDDSVFLWNNAQSTPRSYEEERHNESSESANSSIIKFDDNLELDEDNEVDLLLPALPNEMDKRNGALALPSPKHLAVDAAVSDSNSEDESTSSSQL